MCHQQNNCANKFLQNGIGNCGKDIKCICEDKSFLGEIACCLTDACNEADQKAAVAAAANVSHPSLPYMRQPNPTKQTDT